MTWCIKIVVLKCDFFLIFLVIGCHFFAGGMNDYKLVKHYQRCGIWKCHFCWV